MNKWEKLLDALTHLNDGMTGIEDLFNRDTDIRVALTLRIPVLAVPGAWPIVRKALVDITELAMRERDKAAKQ